MIALGTKRVWGVRPREGGKVVLRTGRGTGGIQRRLDEDLVVALISRTSGQTSWKKRAGGKWRRTWEGTFVSTRLSLGGSEADLRERRYFLAVVGMVGWEDMVLEEAKRG